MNGIRQGVKYQEINQKLRDFLPEVEMANANTMIPINDDITNKMS